MGTSDELKTVDLVEFLGDLVAEQPACAPGRNSPGVDIFGIRPDEITECTFVRYLLCTGDNANLIKSSYFRAQATVHAENTAVNDGSKNKEIEDLATRLPYGCIAVFLLALFIKSVNLCDLARLVVAANQGNAVRISIYVSLGAVLYFPLVLTWLSSTSTE